MEAKKRFRCGRCDYLYDNEDEASFCCAPLPREVFLCGLCNQAFDFEEDASACCAAIDAPVPERCQYTLELPI